MSLHLLVLALVLNLAVAAVATFVAVRTLSEARRANVRALEEERRANEGREADREYLLWLQDHIARGVDLLARGYTSSQDQTGPSNESGDDGDHNRDARRLH